MAESVLDQLTTLKVMNPTFRSVVQAGALEQLPLYLDEAGLAENKAFIVTDSNLRESYGGRLSGILQKAGIDNELLVIKSGETNKSLRQAGQVIEDLADYNANRGDVMIALGGGVVGDLAGLVASIYNRGIPLVHVPTTLLAMVDSSIGGKTGVDHGGKNKTGSFYQPRLVVADPTVLSTLDQRVYTEGFGEIAKYAILDDDFLPELEECAESLRQFSPEGLDVLGNIIARCVAQKSHVIAADPFEQKPNGRILLNYGHTLGHGLEAAGGYDELLHGEAVAIGMNYAAQLAVRLGLADQALIYRQTALLESLGLPMLYTGRATIKDIMINIAKDKKNTSAGTTRFVLPRAIGHMVVQQVENMVVQQSVTDFLAT